jgi:hypothetical protein
VKKLLSISFTLLAVVSINASSSINKNSQEIKSMQDFSDARLSMAKINKDIESRTKYLLKNINKNSTPTDIELNDLVKSIEVVRAYGKDISQQAKLDILKIVKMLTEKNFKDTKILKKLEELTTSSQHLAA